ncbi:MAG: type IVB secretion system protein IcmQ [Gammaproteobacteria bacterium]|nr:type IVB secretion system protein IcmQ [Gammaproteobacteria bacterium]
MDDKEQARLLYREVESLVQQEKALRKQYDIGDRYKAISSRLQALFEHVQESVSLPQQQLSPVRLPSVLGEGERYVFVHLFNAKGKILTRWESMLSPRLLYEYSVNRPIYTQKEQVEAYIRSREDSAQHAFLMMKVLDIKVLNGLEYISHCDSLGQSLIKLKEGALKEENLVCFFHQGERYIFSNGHLSLQSIEC